MLGGRAEVLILRGRYSRKHVNKNNWAAGELFAVYFYACVLLTFSGQGILNTSLDKALESAK